MNYENVLVGASLFGCLGLTQNHLKALKDNTVFHKCARSVLQYFLTFITRLWHSSPGRFVPPEGQKYTVIFY